MAAHNRVGHYIFALWFLSSTSSFFLFSSSTLSGRRLYVYHTSVHGVSIVRFRMQLWNVLRAARRKCRTKKVAKIHHLGTITQFCLAISSQVRQVSRIGKWLKHALQYGELWPTSGWDLLASLRHPRKFQRVSHLGSVILHLTLVAGVS